MLSENCLFFSEKDMSVKDPAIFGKIFKFHKKNSPGHLLLTGFQTNAKSFSSKVKQLAQILNIMSKNLI
jgi:hypothetical protein